MKRFIISFIVMTVIFVLTTSTRADLFDRGGRLIYDDDLGITWLQDANYSGGTMTWSEANSWTDSLTYQGYSRLAASLL